MKEDSYNQAWTKLFNELQIRAHLNDVGRFTLTANQIKKISGKEPRIMSKWDSSEARPKVLSQAGVTILPTSRHGYVLLKGNGYKNLPESAPPVLHSPEKLEQFTTLPWRNDLTKESLVIDIAAVSSMLRTFTGEKDLALTVRGRSGTPAFNFLFDGSEHVHTVTVDRAQIEVDAGFEGECVWLIEAKIGEPKDFLVRQLFYPWRSWTEQTSKPVVPLFLTYTNRTFGLFRYDFADPQNYHSITLRESRWFTLDEPECVASLEDLYEASNSVVPPTNVFPQADTLGNVIAAVELFAEDISEVAQLALRWGYDRRQGHYYADAAEWLGFIARRGKRRELTRRGANFCTANRWERFELLFQAVVATPVFRECIRQKLIGGLPEKAEIAEMILKQGYGNRTTANRRAKTVLDWVDWLWHEHLNLQSTR